MHDSPPSQVTVLLQRMAGGDSRAHADLLVLLYDELHRLAERQMRGERANHTLQPTALVHEAWMRLAAPPPGAGEPQWESRSHFLCVAAKAMRNMLVDHERRRRSQKRSRAAQLELDDALALYESRALDVLALNEALERLALRDAELARIVELRFFGGLTVEETGKALGLTVRQVEGAWVTARGWLRRELGRGETS